MNQRIEKLRQLLIELEVETEAHPLGDCGFSALELPFIVQQIVDDLQPLLTPYDAAFYWFLFRHSVAKNGSPYIRVSTRFLQRAVVRSSYSQAQENTISLGKVQETLRALEAVGAIRKEGEANRHGTQYRVHIPEEIEACHAFRAERLAVEPTLMFPTSDGETGKSREIRLQVFERDRYTCHACGKVLTRFTATLDYLEPPAEGGNNSPENLITACLDCNSRRGSN